MLNEMEVARAGGCCCAARASMRAPHDLRPSSEVQKILLRFRPIAPRPVPPPPPGSAGGSTKQPEDGMGGSCVEKNGKRRSRAADEEGESSRRTRSTRTRRGPKPKKKSQASPAEAAAGSSSVTTSATSSEGEVALVRPEMGAAVDALPLVPEAPALKELPIQFPTTELLHVTAGWWERPQVAAAGTSHIAAPTPHRPVCSVVTVVGSTAGEWEIAGDDEQQRSAGWLAGCEEQEAKRKLWTDIRPALVSDLSGKVIWANAAYRRMVGALDIDDEKATAAAVDERGGVANGEGVRTLLAAPAAALEKGTPAFSCRVKVRWCGAGRKGRPEKGSMTAPCDVWQLAGGSLVWRIDVGAALSLGPIGP